MKKILFGLISFSGLSTTFFLFFPASNQLMAAWDCDAISIEYDSLVYIDPACGSCHIANINLNNTPNDIGVADLYLEYNPDELEYVNYTGVNCLPETFNHSYDVMDFGPGILYAYSIAGDPIPAGYTGCFFKFSFRNLVYPDLPEICIVNFGNSDLPGWCELLTCCHVKTNPESQSLGLSNHER